MGRGFPSTGHMQVIKKIQEKEMKQCILMYSHYFEYASYQLNYTSVWGAYNSKLIYRI